MVFQDYPKYMKWKIIQIFETNQIIIYLYLTIIPLLTISSHYIPYKLLLLSPMFFSSPVMAKKIRPGRNSSVRFLRRVRSVARADHFACEAGPGWLARWLAMELYSERKCLK
jgi:hypothetical protein